MPPMMEVAAAMETGVPSGVSQNADIHDRILSVVPKGCCTRLIVREMGAGY